MREMSRTQKRINSVTLVCVVSFFLVWWLVYRPSKKVIGELKAELDGIQMQIRQIEGKDAGEGARHDDFQRVEARYRWVNAKFPRKEEKALRMLSELAKDAGVEVLSIRSQPKALFLDENAQEVRIDGRVCRKLLVSIEIKGLYGDLIAYLDALAESLPAFVTVENLQIRNEAAGARTLSVGLDIYMFLLT